MINRSADPADHVLPDNSPLTKRDMALIHIAAIRLEHLGIDMPPDDLYLPEYVPYLSDEDGYGREDMGMGMVSG